MRRFAPGSHEMPAYQTFRLGPRSSDLNDRHWAAGLQLPQLRPFSKTSFEGEGVEAQGFLERVSLAAGLQLSYIYIHVSRNICICTYAIAPFKWKAVRGRLLFHGFVVVRSSGSPLVSAY